MRSSSRSCEQLLAKFLCMLALSFLLFTHTECRFLPSNHVASHFILLLNCYQKCRLVLGSRNTSLHKQYVIWLWMNVHKLRENRRKVSRKATVCVQEEHYWSFASENGFSFVFKRSHGILLGVVGSDVPLRELLKLAPRYKVRLR